MGARLRRQGEAAPMYDGDSDEFSVEIHHGGYFVGHGQLRSYLDGKVSWFDHVEADTWSILWLEQFVEDLGYLRSPSLKFYWLLPEKYILDGLRFIECDNDTIVMTQAAEKYKNLVVYFDHDDRVVDNSWDDIAYNPVAELPTVLSPSKGNYGDNKCGEKLPSFYEQLPTGRERISTVRERRVEQKENDIPEEVDDDSEDSDFVDSDYELDDGDDDLFVDNVDDNVVDEGAAKGNKNSKGKKAKGSKLKGKEVCASAQDDGEVSTDDENNLLPMGATKGEVRFKSFREEDMNNPTFYVGLVFHSVVSLRQAITEYSVRNMVEIKMPRNDKKRIRAHCAEGCPWNLYALEDSGVKTFVVKTYCGEHNCQREWTLNRCTSKWLAGKYLESFRADNKMSLTNFSRTVQKEWNLAPSRSKLARARRIAMKEIHGDEVQQYNMLWDYAEELRRSNPGTNFYLKLEGSLFQQCYMARDACKRGFLSGCRPIICLDGCHIKNKFGGQLLTAVGIDPNDCIFPIAMAVVEVESLLTWKWFLETLKNDLGIDNTTPWTIMTDKQKGLIPAVQQVFPDSEHRFCVRHLYSNFQVHFKGEVVKNQLWACARSSSISEWNRNMDRMRVLNQKAYEWLEKMPPNTWVRAFFSEFPKCDILLNNSCEVFNKYILDARELPILSMLERIKGQLMTSHYNKQKELLEHMPGNFCPKIRKKVLKNAEAANLCYALPAGQGVFQVHERDYQYIVDITSRHCDCRKWDLTGIPCNHAISCLRHERIPSESVLPKCYSVDTFSKAYGYNIWPCQDKSKWEKVNGSQVLPPVYEKKIGRPPKSRRKKPFEVQGQNGPKLTKLGVVIHCKHCGGGNHNSGGCSLKKQGMSSEQAKKMVAAELETPQHPMDEPINVVAQDVIDEDPGSQIMSQLSSNPGTTLVGDMLGQPSQTTLASKQLGPLPDSEFISTNRPVERPMALSTCIKQGKQAAATAARKRKEARATTATAKKKPAAGA